MKADVYFRTQIAVFAQKKVGGDIFCIVVLTPFLDSPNLPKEGLSGLKGNFLGVIPKFDNI